MPATGIEPVWEYKSRRILSPVRLPIPPPRHNLWWTGISGRRDSNPRPPPWQGDVLPLNYFRIMHGNVLPSQGAIPQLLSALWSLTSVFGMGTGISSMPSSPHYFLWENLVLSKLDNIHFSFQELAFFWLSPRPISNGPLHASPHFHFHPIYLIISQGS